VALAACQTAAPSSQLRAEQFTGAAAAAAERANAPGIVAAIYRNGALDRIFAWGGARCDGEGVADIADAYEIGSISKQITAVAILQLVEAGAVELDAPVGRYLDDIPEAWRAVTLRQLLTHTSGVPDYEAAAGYIIYESPATPADVYASVAQRPLDFEPGARWSYSNTGYYLLSLVVERMSGRPFGAYLRDRIFRPLGMTGAHLSDGQVDASLAQGCKPGDEGHIAVLPISPGSTLGAGGIVSSLQDWAAWDAAFGEDLISSQSWAEMLSPAELSDGRAVGYGFGVEVGDHRGARQQMHSGQTAGFSAVYIRLPDLDTSIAVFANTYGARLAGVADALLIEAAPQLSYHRRTAPADPASEQTAASRRALQQAALGQAPLDLLSDGMRSFATDPDYGPLRDEIVPVVSALEGFEFLEVGPPGNNGARRYLYRASGGGIVKYFGMTWRDGRLVALNWEDE